MAEQITRYDAKSLNSPEVSAEIIQGVVTQSAALSLFTRLPNMTTDVLRMPVLESLPDAYWVDEDKNNGRKGTTRMAWANKWIYAEELAVIVPIKENLLNDADYPIWEQVRPRVIEAFHKKIDDAIFTGKNKPKNFPADLLSAVNQVGAFITGTDDLYKDISNAMGKVEESDYNPTGIVGSLGMKKLFRDMLDTYGRPITDTEVNGLTKTFVNNGSWDKEKALYIVGDFTQAVYSIRQDVEVKLLTEGVIQGDDGNIVYNLAQDDMVALRFTMRLGWAIPNPINAAQPDESVRFPFAAVKGSGDIGAQTLQFTVQDSEETEIEGARVSYGGLVKYTNASGQAEFKVQDNTYPYSVSYNGETVFGEAKSSDSTLTVKLTQKKN